MNKLIRPAAALAAVFFCATAAMADEALRRDAAALFGRLEPVSPAVLASPEVELGRALFWDERL